VAAGVVPFDAVVAVVAAGPDPTVVPVVAPPWAAAGVAGPVAGAAPVEVAPPVDADAEVPVPPPVTAVVDVPAEADVPDAAWPDPSETFFPPDPVEQATATAPVTSAKATMASRCVSTRRDPMWSMSNPLPGSAAAYINCFGVFGVEPNAI
jgi:hypothetical protein